ncbi:cysteine--tRNA ligase [Aerococcaceae bacterium WGS1372]
MSIYLYNTLTRQKELFKPLEEGVVNFYLCGPTVYNYIHIGNARSSVAFDTVRRYLEYRGYQVNYVTNFTDVDDKIIKAAKEEGITPKEVADKYIQAFKKDTGALNIKPATAYPRVMDNIQEIIDFNQQLINKGHAYEAGGDVYFRTESFEKYGELSNKTIDELRFGASERVSQDEFNKKENPIDFALWKKAKEDEISWESPWGQGRPGWHIECSVMSTKYLGETLDIHAGGQDLEFPHHENEIAQSESHYDKTFSNYWMHNGFVTFGQDEEKMSKSLGNFVLLRDLLEEVDPMVIRYLLSTVHYRRPLKYDQGAIEDATNNVARLREVLRRLNYRMEQTESPSELNHSAWEDKLQAIEADFIKVMDDDFNAANGMTAIFEMVKVINLYLEEETVDKEVLTLMNNKLTELLSIFGLQLTQSELLDETIQALIDERNQARSDRQFQRADEIRDQLKDQGILLNDTPHGTQWKRER